MHKKHIALALRIATWTASVAVAWQAVRFCQGEVGAPVVDLLLNAIRATLEPLPAAAGPNGEIFGWMHKIFYYLSGVSLWLALASIVRSSGWALSRIVEVGLARYRTEMGDAARLAALAQADRRRATQLLPGQNEAAIATATSESALTALVIGFLVAGLFF